MNVRSALERFPRLYRGLSAIARRWSKPPHSALGRAHAIAFIVTSPSDGQRRPWIDEAAARGAEIDLLPVFQAYRRGDGKIMSFLMPPPREEYDCIVVSRSIDLFDHSWSYAFLERLNSLLSREGTILVPKASDAARLIPDKRLIELFGHAPHEKGRRYLGFSKAQGGLHRPADAAHSTLDAYWPLHENLIHGRFDESLSDTILALGAERADKRKPYTSRDTVDLLQSQTYRTCSASTKAAMTGYLASVYFPDRHDLHLADLGAGTGLNSLELLLGASRVSKVTLVEPNRAYHWDIAAVYDHFRDRLRGKVVLVDKPVEAYRGVPVDIGLVCGVFSMLPQEIREPFALGAWSNIAPGGVLAVLENMRTPGASDYRYNAQRFIPSEIDAMLGRFGPIRYFENDAMREVRPADVGNRTVFRVIRKPR